MAEKILSCFIDESGDFGPYDFRSPYYYVAMVLHDQSEDISEKISVMESRAANNGYPNHAIHTGPLIRRENVYINEQMEDRKHLFNVLYFFTVQLPIRYFCAKVNKAECSDDIQQTAKLSRAITTELQDHLDYKTSGTLLYPYTQPDITGRNNQLIELRKANGSLNTGLFLIDSNAYTGEGINVYDFIHDDQVGWYAGEVERMHAEAGHDVPSMIFFHIPLQQYRTAYELYEAGSSEVTWFFGENGEKMINKVCCSEYPSSLFDRARELGCEAMFCGHDHYNNMSLEYEGIRLTYGMSIDYLVMPGIEKDTAQRGGELVTIHHDGSWDLQQIPLISIEK